METERLNSCRGGLGLVPGTRNWVSYLEIRGQGQGLKLVKKSPQDTIRLVLRLLWHSDKQEVVENLITGRSRSMLGRLTWIITSWSKHNPLCL